MRCTPERLQSEAVHTVFTPKRQKNKKGYGDFRNPLILFGAEAGIALIHFNLLKSLCATTQKLPVFGVNLQPIRNQMQPLAR
jgi:hypothetical protein